MIAGAREPLVAVIEPRPPGVRARLGEAWRARRLVGFFGRRLISKLYARTLLGRLWIPLRPTLDVGVKVLIFGSLLAAPSNGIPYFLFLVVGTSAWELFASTTMWATRSIELNRRVLRAMYVPRLTTLAGAAAPGLLVYSMHVVITAVALTFFAVKDDHLYLEFGVDTLLLPAGLALGVLLALAIGLWTSVWGVRGRDTRFTLGYVLSLLYFVTPVVYPLSAVPDGVRTLAELNPMTAPVEMVRLGVFGIGEVPLTGLAVTLVWIAVIAIPGVVYYARAEAAALDAL